MQTPTTPSQLLLPSVHSSMSNNEPQQFKLKAPICSMTKSKVQGLWQTRCKLELNDSLSNQQFIEQQFIEHYIYQIDSLSKWHIWFKCCKTLLQSGPRAAIHSCSHKVITLCLIYCKCKVRSCLSLVSTESWEDSEPSRPEVRTAVKGAIVSNCYIV